MNRANVNAERLEFNVQTRGQLRDERLGTRVHGRKGSGNKASDAAGKDDAASLLVADHLLGKVVSDVDGRRGVAFNVDQELFNGRCGW